jgi:hypothetical protein
MFFSQYVCNSCYTGIIYFHLQTIAQAEACVFFCSLKGGHKKIPYILAIERRMVCNDGSKEKSGCGWSSYQQQ